MNGILGAGLAFAADAALKATLLFLLTVLAVVLLRRSGAAARHFAGTAGLVGAIALPFLALALPRWEVPLLPPVVTAELKSAETWRPARPAIVKPGIDESVSEIPADSPAPASAEASRPAETLPAPAAPRVPWLAIALGAWAAGTVLTGARLAVGVRRVRAIRQEAARLRDPEWIEETENLSARLAVRRSVELYESARVPVAITSGLFRPFLLLCRQARLWAVERRRVVLLHELAHVKRGDWIWLVLAEAALALYWWHPLAWVLVNQVRRDGEKACDDLVLAAGTKPSVYAGHLLGIFRSLSAAAHPVAPAVTSARPSHFEGRLRSILDPASPRRELPRMRAAMAAAGLIAAAALLSAVAPWASECSGAAVLGPITPAADELTRSDPAEGKCPEAASRAAKAPRAVRAAVGASSASPSATASPSVSPAVASPEAESEENLPEPGRTIPAVLKALEKLKDSGGFLRASKGLTKAGKRDGSEWYSRAMDLHHDGQYDEAIAAFEKAIEAGYREEASSYNIACGYARKGDRDKAFEWSKRAMDAGFDLEKYLGHDDDLDGLKPDPRWTHLKSQVASQPSARREREAAAAVARWERLVAKNPKDGEPYYHIGKDLLDAGRYDLSAKAFAEAASRGYRTGASLYNEGCALSRGGQTRAALDMLQKALDAGFDQPNLFAKDDDLDNVRDDPRFAQIAKEAKDLSLPGYGTGAWSRSFNQRDRWREAARRFEEYARANPQKGRAWFNLGFASLAGDRPEASIDAFKKALDLNYRKPTTMYNLACGHARLDQKDQAFDWLFKALDAGFDASGTLRGDEDLDNLRGDPRYRKALEIARARDKRAGDEDND
jgi:beta-lactamase regulating signal transducer with metallopeptidase domain/Tfp pilus assembly protein PilF